MKILAIESSCDETAAAVVENGRIVLSSVVASQVEDHRKYGGVVPEIASRMHAEAISSVTKKALDDAGLIMNQIDAVAVTYAPGLIGALLVGVNFAKGLAYSAGVPLIPVHHLRGHIAANYIAHEELKPPFLCLVVSGGHTHIIKVKDYVSMEIIGRTRDDAAGEAFDKAARAMGMPYPGGTFIDGIADKGNPDNFTLPIPKITDSRYDFSFSGLKTAVINLVHNASQKGQELPVNDIAASLRKTIVNMLTSHLMLAAEDTGSKTLVLAGGVSANKELRSRMDKLCAERGYKLFYPPLSLCGDNAAMIGAQAYYEAQAGNFADLSLNACANMSIE